MESHLSAAGSPPRIFLEEIGDGLRARRAQNGPVFFLVFSPDRSGICGLHKYGRITCGGDQKTEEAPSSAHCRLRHNSMVHEEIEDDIQVKLVSIWGQFKYSHPGRACRRRRDREEP